MISISGCQLLSHPQQEVICTNFKNLTQPTEQDVTFSPQQQLTAGMDCQRMWLRLGLSMNLRAN